MYVGKLGDIAGNGMLDIIIEAARADGWHAELSADLHVWLITRGAVCVSVRRTGLTTADALALLDWCNVSGLMDKISARMR